jgi:two-component system, OmpR family, response regulator RegX3
MNEGASGGCILVVEDERSIAEPLLRALRREGFSPVHAPTAASALELAASERPRLVLLDLALPDGDGRDVCRTLRKDSDVPIVMLTARGTETDRIVGLELGADDYVVKPFSSGELVARIRAILRRAEGSAPRAAPIHLRVGALEIDEARRVASVESEPADLTRKEFDLLLRLAREPGVVVTRETLMADVWDENWWGSTKTLDVHISSLRRKLGEDPAVPRYIHTSRGVGFRLAAPEEAAP